MPPKCRHHYNSQEKLNIVIRSDDIGPLAASKEFRISVHNVKRWRKERSILATISKMKDSLNKGYTPPNRPSLKKDLVESVKSKKQKEHDCSGILKGLKAKQKCRQHYNSQDKLNIVARSDEIGLLAASKEFGIRVQNVKRWRKERHVLVTMPKIKKSLNNGTPPKWPSLEKDLVECVKSKQQKGNTFSGVLKRLKVKPKYRQHYKAHEKLNIVARSDEIGPLAASKEFKISVQNVKRWRKKRNIIATMPKMKASLNKGTPPKWPSLEKDLVEWVKFKRQKEHKISGVQIRLKAKEIAQERNIHDFTGTISWFYRFMQRHNVSLRVKTPVSKKLPDNLEYLVKSFKNVVARAIKQMNVLPTNIFNMDEVLLIFDMPPSRTDMKDQKTNFVKITGHEKFSFTVVLGCSSSGHKLKPMLIFKSKTMPKKGNTNDVVVKVNPKGWMSEEMMLEWIDKVLCTDSTSHNKLLIIDSIPVHQIESVQTHCTNRHTSLAFIPAGLTKHLQPLDMSISNDFKVEVRRQWEKWLMRGPHTFTNTKRMRGPTIAEVSSWVEVAWAKIEDSSIQKAFVTAGVMPTPQFLLEKLASSTPMEDANVIERNNEETGLDLWTDLVETVLIEDNNSDSDSDIIEMDNSDVQEDTRSKDEPFWFKNFYSDSDDSEFLGFA